MNELLYEGKAKQIFSTEDKNKVIMYFKDEATAFNGVKKAIIDNKGIINNKITTLIFNYLKLNGIKTHHIKTLDERRQLTYKVNVIPLEFICRNIAAASIAKKLGLDEGYVFDKPVLEICYKDDKLNDPLINETHAYNLGIIDKDSLNYCYQQVLLVNKLLQDLFQKIGITLVDFKLEFGINSENEIVLVDEISPDNCRLWDSKTKTKLDKDVFRQDLGNLIDSYQLILDKLESRA